MEIKVQKINTIICFITTLPFVFIPMFIITIVIINCCHDDAKVSNITIQNTFVPPITSNNTVNEEEKVIIPTFQEFVPVTQVEDLPLVVETHKNALMKKSIQSIITHDKEIKQKTTQQK